MTRIASILYTGLISYKALVRELLKCLAALTVHGPLPRFLFVSPRFPKSVYDLVSSQVSETTSLKVNRCNSLCVLQLTLTKHSSPSCPPNFVVQYWHFSHTCCLPLQNGYSVWGLLELYCYPQTQLVLFSLSAPPGCLSFWAHGTSFVWKTAVMCVVRKQERRGA